MNFIQTRRPWCSPNKFSKVVVPDGETLDEADIIIPPEPQIDSTILAQNEATYRTNLAKRGMSESDIDYCVIAMDKYYNQYRQYVFGETPEPVMEPLTEDDAVTLGNSEIIETRDINLSQDAANNLTSNDQALLQSSIGAINNRNSYNSNNITQTPSLLSSPLPYDNVNGKQEYTLYEIAIELLMYTRTLMPESLAELLELKSSPSTKQTLVMVYNPDFPIWNKLEVDVVAAANAAKDTNKPNKSNESNNANDAHDAYTDNIAQLVVRSDPKATMFAHVDYITESGNTMNGVRVFEKVKDNNDPTGFSWKARKQDKTLIKKIIGDFFGSDSNNNANNINIREQQLSVLLYSPIQNKWAQLNMNAARTAHIASINHTASNYELPPYVLEQDSNATIYARVDYIIQDGKQFGTANIFKKNVVMIDDVPIDSWDQDGVTYVINKTDDLSEFLVTISNQQKEAQIDGFVEEQSSAVPIVSDSFKTVMYRFKTTRGMQRFRSWGWTPLTINNTTNTPADLTDATNIHEVDDGSMYAQVEYVENEGSYAANIKVFKRESGDGDGDGDDDGDGDGDDSPANPWTQLGDTIMLSTPNDITGLVVNLTTSPTPTLTVGYELPQTFMYQLNPSSEWSQLSINNSTNTPADLTDATHIHEVDNGSMYAQAEYVENEGEYSGAIKVFKRGSAIGDGSTANKWTQLGDTITLSTPNDITGLVVKLTTSTTPTLTVGYELDTAAVNISKQRRLDTAIQDIPKTALSVQDQAAAVASTDNQEQAIHAMLQDGDYETHASTIASDFDVSGNFNELMS